MQGFGVDKIYQAKTTKKKSRVAILISDKESIRNKAINKESVPLFREPKKRKQMIQTILSEFDITVDTGNNKTFTNI